MMSYLIALLVIALIIWIIYMLSGLIPHLQHRRSFTILIAAALLLSFLKFALWHPELSFTSWLPNFVWIICHPHPVLSQSYFLLIQIIQPIWQFFMLVVVAFGTPVFVIFFMLIYLREFRRMNMQSRIVLTIALLVCIYAILNLLNLFFGFWPI